MGNTQSVSELLKLNRRPRRQKGERIESATAFFIRYYITSPTGERKQKSVKLADKSELYRTWEDVEPLIEQELNRANDSSDTPTGRWTLTDFFEKSYLPWVKTTKAAATHECYRMNWVSKLKPHLADISLVNLTTAQVTTLLTYFAKPHAGNDGRQKPGLGSQALSRIKFTLSGAYQYAIALGVVSNGNNPVNGSKWLVKKERPKQQAVYTLEQVVSMLIVLEAVDIRAAVAVALAYFTAIRPAEIRGLQWADYTGEELHIRRAMWRNVVGETKTEDSVASVPVRDTLKRLLGLLYDEAKKKEQARLQTEGIQNDIFNSCGALNAGSSASAYILQNAAGRPLSLDSMNWRVIRPALKKAGIEWHGYYPGRRGVSGKVTDVSGNALNSTGLLRHANPVTTLKYYTRAQKDSVGAAMDLVEAEAVELRKKLEAEAGSVQ